MSCGVGQRCGSEPALLWLWHRPAAIAPIQPQAWELPYAVSVALKKAKKKKKKKKGRERENLETSPTRRLENGSPGEPPHLASLASREGRPTAKVFIFQLMKGIEAGIRAA